MRRVQLQRYKGEMKAQPLFNLFMFENQKYTLIVMKQYNIIRYCLLSFTHLKTTYPHRQTSISDFVTTPLVFAL